MRPPLTDPQAVAALRNEIRSKIKQLAGYEPIAVPLSVKPFGVIHNDGYHIEKLTYASEPGIIVPSLLFVPENGEGRKPGVLYVNSKGKANSGGEIEALVKSGMVVLAIDARGWGETATMPAGEAKRLGYWTCSSRIMTRDDRHAAGQDLGGHAR